MLLSVVLLLVIFFLLLVLSMLWPPDSPWAPWWRTDAKTAKAICKLAKISSKDTIYDLGCGDGEVLLHSAKLGARGVGIEIDPVRVFIARMRVFINNLGQKVIIKRNNFFNEKYSDATVIIVYLIPKTLDKLLPRFKKQLKKGTRIVSFRYEMKMPLKGIDKENDIRLYII